MTFFLFNDFRIKGFYFNPVIELIFILITLTYFTIVRNSKRKILSVFILTPLILLSLIILIFSTKSYELKIDNQHKIQVTTGGIMACGDIIHMTETKFVIFDKEIYYEGSLCLREITQIKTILFNKDSAEFLIYHNGELDSENPYQYKIENKNLW